jgi:hypothetical protein
MTFFRILAYLAPAAAGLGVAAALALTRGRPPRRRLVAALASLGAVLVVLGLAAFTESLRAFHAVALLTAGFSILVAGFFLFTEALRLPAEAGQVLSGLLIAALFGTAFLFAPALRRAEETGASMETISRRVTRTLEVNPFMVVGYSVFGRDLLRSRTFYPLGLESYPFGTPRWGASAAGYALAGFVLFAGAVCLSALRLRGISPKRPGGPAP